MKEVEIKTLFDSKERLEKIPELNSFLINCETTIQSNQNADSFWDCKPYFSELIASDFLLKLINWELTKTALNSTHLPVGSISEQDLAVLITNNFTLNLKLLDPSVIFSTPLYSGSQHLMMAIIGKSNTSSTVVEVFYQPHPLPNEILDPAKKLIRSGEKQCAEKEIMCFRAGYDIFRIKSTTEPIVILFFSSKNVFSLRWEYDSTTYFPNRAIAANSSSSRLDYTAKLLGEINNYDSIKALKNLLTHNDHFVRWSAAKNIFKIDFSEGIEALKICVLDDHPHIREAAKNTLLRIQAEINSES